jgi:hypothetical protein
VAIVWVVALYVTCLLSSPGNFSFSSGRQSLPFCYPTARQDFVSIFLTNDANSQKTERHFLHRGLLSSSPLPRPPFSGEGVKEWGKSSGVAELSVQMGAGRRVGTHLTITAQRGTG